MDNNFDEKIEIKTLQKEINRLEKLFSVFTKIKNSEPDSLDKLEQALKALPPGHIIGQAIEEIRTKIDDFLQNARKMRRESFGRIEAEYIKTIREGNQSLREQANGWRVGPIEIEMAREQSRVRFLYNREVLISWRSIQSKEDLEKLSQTAIAMLNKMSLPEDLLVRVFLNAYQHLKDDRLRLRSPNTEMIPISDFYREVRAQLVRVQLESKKPDSKLSYVDLPKWAFLYNLDLYRSLPTSDGRKRLGFQTGSQVEVGKGMGFVTNGLNARDDYKTYCYVVG